MAQHITVKDYDPAWRELYEREKALIADILQENLVAVYHIGSTSVPALAAKPVIDIMVAVKSLDAADGAAGAFEEAGYEYLGESGIAGRRYLRKGGDMRTHQLHIFAHSSRHDVERHLAVRDYLRTHQATARRYGELKAALAEKFPYDIQGYCDGKAPFMKVLEQTALAWRREQGKGNL